MVQIKIGIVSGEAYCVPLLQALVNGQIQTSVFVGDSSVDHDLTVVKCFCAETNVPFKQGELELLYFWIAKEKPDLIFVMGFKHLIDLERLPDTLKQHIYNIHFGALPAYMGLNPVFWQIKNGAALLAVAIHLLSEQFNAGDIIWKREIKREFHLSYGTAQLLLSQVVIEGVRYIIQQTFLENSLMVKFRDNKKSHYYHHPERKDVLIQWDKMDAKEVVNLILACNPWNKGAITFFNGLELKILDAEVMENTAIALNLGEPGLIVNHHHGLQVTCSDKMIINVTMLNVDGTFIPARHAFMFGFVQGKFFGS